MTIRRAGPADLEPALAAMGRAFGLTVPNPSVHTLVAGAADGTLLVAERDGEIVGTGASVGFGPTGWLGGIVVALQARGGGLGRALTEAAIAALGERATVLLLASDLGRPIYERLGFVGEGRYRVFMTPPWAAPVVGPRVRPLIPADREAVRALDAQVTGEDRTVALDAGLAGGLAIDADTGAGALAGFALRPPFPARPIVARDPAAGAALLAAIFEPELRLAVPEANAPAVAALIAHGCQERAGVLRMRRGAPVAWQPDAIWGVFSLFFG